MKTVKIHNRDYIMVNERIKMFRQVHADWTIKTSIVNMSDEDVVVRAEVLDPSGRLIADGYAHETRAGSMINRTSYLENCQTSAIGRCLGIFGIGLSTSVASAEEVLRAIEQQANLKGATNGKTQTKTTTNSQNKDSITERARV